MCQSDLCQQQTYLWQWLNIFYYFVQQPSGYAAFDRTLICARLSLRGNVHRNYYYLIAAYSGEFRQNAHQGMFNSHIGSYVLLVLTGRGITIPTEQSLHSVQLGGSIRGILRNSGLSGRKEQPSSRSWYF